MTIGPWTQISPGLVAGDVSAGIIDDPDLHARDRFADAAGPMYLRRVKGNGQAGFGHAVRFQKRHAESREERFAQACARAARHR